MHHGISAKKIHVKILKMQFAKIFPFIICFFSDRETIIMHRLQDTVLEHSAVLSHVMEHTAELDW